MFAQNTLMTLWWIITLLSLLLFCPERKKNQLRPQFRPGFRRPPLTLNKKSKPSQSNDIGDTTETTTSSSTTRSSPYSRRRSRPTYIPTTAQTPTLSASRSNDTIVGKIIQRRKFGRPTNAAAANERKRYTGAAQSKSRPTTESSKSLVSSHLSYSHRVYACECLRATVSEREYKIFRLLFS